jgi:hypothetical protein
VRDVSGDLENRWEEKQLPKSLPRTERRCSQTKITRALIFTALLVTSGVNCTKEPLTVVTTANSQGVVLPVSIAPGVLNQCSRPTPKAPDGYWEPKERDVQSLEGLLPAYIRARKEYQAARVLERLSKYRRQYAGFVRDGHKTIYVNLFWPEYGVQWRSEVVRVCDGDIGFWGVEFDTTSNTFVHIAYNGSG